jgi:hypothetical protein
MVILLMFLDTPKDMTVKEMFERLIPGFFSIKVLVSIIVAFLLTVGIAYAIQLTNETEILGIFIVMFLMIYVIYLLFQQPEVFSESYRDKQDSDKWP